MEVPNDVPDRGWVIGYVSALSGITSSFCLVRVASRLSRGTLSFGFDDLFIALSWLTSTAMTTLIIIGNVKYHFQRPAASVEPEFLPIAMEFIWILNILYLAQTGFAKVSILLFYQRLVESTCSRRFRFAIWALIALISVYSVAIFVVYMTECMPIPATWLRYDLEWRESHDVFCASQTQNLAVAWVAGLMAVLTTFLTTLLPSWLFIQIRLSRRARIALAIILALGFLAVIPSIFRLVYLIRAAQPGADRLWQSYKALISGKTEGDVGIVCACAPSLNIFFRRFFRDRGQERTSDARGSGTHPTTSDIGESGFARFASMLTGTSGRSTRSGPVGKSALSTNASHRPGLRVPQAFRFSMDDIPEAYAQTKAIKRRSQNEQSSEGGSQRTGPSSRAARFKKLPKMQSWLNLDPESSEEETEKGTWFSEKDDKAQPPHR